MAELKLTNAAGTTIIVDGTNANQVRFLNDRGYRAADAPKRGRKPKDSEADTDADE